MSPSIRRPYILWNSIKYHVTYALVTEYGDTEITQGSGILIYPSMQGVRGPLVSTNDDRETVTETNKSTTTPNVFFYEDCDGP